MSDDYSEVFSAEPPIPRCKQKNIPTSKNGELKPKRKYTRKSEDCQESNNADSQSIDIEPMMIAESLFEDSQLCSYYMVKSFIELCSMVESKNHKRLALILEGLIVK